MSEIFSQVFPHSCKWQDAKSFSLIQYCWQLHYNMPVLMEKLFQKIKAGSEYLIPELTVRQYNLSFHMRELILWGI